MSTTDLFASLETLPMVDLQKLANYRTLKKVLNRSGWWSFAFAGLAMVTALNASRLTSAAPLLGLAILLVIQGLWLRRADRPIGLIFGGLTLIGLGLWTMGIAGAEEAGGSQSSPWFVLGVWQIAWGVGTLRRFDDLRLRHLDSVKPNVEALDSIDRVVADIWSTKTKEAPDQVVFVAITWVRSTQLTGRLTPTMALFTTEKGDDVFVADRSRTMITPTGKVHPKKKFKATLQVGDRVFKGTITPESFQRYQSWMSE